MSCHLSTRRRFVHQQLSAPHKCLPHRNRGNKEWSKQSDCSILQGIRVGSVEEHNQYSSKLPQRIQSSSPGKMAFISPSSKLIPSKFWKLIPSQGTNASPGFIQRVISLTGYNWVILSQKPRKERPRRSLLTPSEVY